MKFKKIAENQLKELKILQKTSVITRQTTQAAKVKTRAMVKELEAKKPNVSLSEAKRRGKQKVLQKEENVIVKDIYGNVSEGFLDKDYLGNSRNFLFCRL